MSWLQPQFQAWKRRPAPLIECVSPGLDCKAVCRCLSLIFRGQKSSRVVKFANKGRFIATSSSLSFSRLPCAWLSPARPSSFFLSSWLMIESRALKILIKDSIIALCLISPLSLSESTQQHIAPACTECVCAPTEPAERRERWARKMTFCQSAFLFAQRYFNQFGWRWKGLVRSLFLIGLLSVTTNANLRRVHSLNLVLFGVAVLRVRWANNKRFLLLQWDQFTFAVFTRFLVHKECVEVDLNRAS